MPLKTLAKAREKPREAAHQTLTMKFLYL